MLKVILLSTLLSSSFLAMARADQASDDAMWARRCESARQRGIHLEGCGTGSTGGGDRDSRDGDNDRDWSRSGRGGRDGGRDWSRNGGSDSGRGGRDNGRGGRSLGKEEWENVRIEGLNALVNAAKNPIVTAEEKKAFIAAYTDLKYARLKQGSNYECNDSPNTSYSDEPAGASAYATLGGGKGGSIWICERPTPDTLIHETGHLMGRGECGADSLAIKAMFYGANQVVRGGYDDHCPKNVDLQNQFSGNTRGSGRGGGGDDRQDWSRGNGQDGRRDWSRGDGSRSWSRNGRDDR